MSKLSALLLLIVSLFVMSAVGMMILTAVTEVGRLALTTNNEGMNR